MLRTVRSAALAAALVLLSCHGSGPPPNPGGPSAVVLPGESASFLESASQALACDPSAITWAIQEGFVGGSVSAAGVYTAPPCGPAFVAGTYHLLAQGCGKVATLPVAVSEEVLQVELACVIVAPGTTCQDPAAGITMAPGGTAKFFARVTLSCHSVFSPPIPSGACSAAFCQ
jgi:hypothetical protein